MMTPIENALRRAGKIAVILAPILVAALGSTASADRWLPFVDRRVVSPSGTRYAVIRRTDRGIRYVLCERRPGVPPMAASPAPTFMERMMRSAADAKTIGRDPEDEILARGECAHLPVDVHVLDAGGIVLFETYRSFGRGTTATYIDARGTVRTTKTLRDIFGGTPPGTRHASTSDWWCFGHLVDQEAKSLVVFSCGGAMREIRLETGEVLVPGEERLLRWCRIGTPAGRRLALDILRYENHERRGPLPFKCGAEHTMSFTLRDVTTCQHRVVATARAIADNEREPMMLRVRAALIVKRLAAPGNYGRLFIEATEPGRDAAARDFAAAYVVEVLGDGAIPALRNLVLEDARKRPYRVSRYVQQALETLGETAVPMLIAVAEDETLGKGPRRFALRELRRHPTEAVKSALWKIARSSEDMVACVAIDGITDIYGADAAQRLNALFGKGPRVTHRLARFYRTYPFRAAIAPLERAAKRFEPTKSTGRMIAKALAACRRARH